MLTACGPNEPATKKAASAAAPRITQFYSTKPSIARGDESVLCYGVENVSAVRLTPAEEKLSPSLSRCFAVKPAATTEYTLTAEGANSATASQSVTITVGGPPPKFLDVSINTMRVAPGGLVAFCFKAANARSVAGEPGRFQNGGNSAGDCLLDHPQQTATYRLTITGDGGASDKREIRVEVR